MVKYGYSMEHYFNGEFHERYGTKLFANDNEAENYFSRNAYTDYWKVR
jgi:hypothetical protein